MKLTLARRRALRWHPGRFCATVSPVTTYMKRALAFIVAPLTIIAGIATTAAAFAPSGATPVNGCIQYTTHNAYMCIAGNSGGTLYWTDYLFTRQFYDHPASGNLTVTESFYCGPSDHGHAGTYDNWCPKPAPGIVAGTHDYARRVISLADGCVITRWNVYDSVASPPAPQWCTSQSTGLTRPTTALEKRSALAFWHVMNLVPGEW